MEIKVFFILVALLSVSTGAVFAQGPPIISVHTDDNQYSEGDTIAISGRVATILGDTPIILQIFNDGNRIHVAQITIAQDGSYTHTTIAGGLLWKKQGEYVVKALYGPVVTAETDFTYTPESKIIQVVTDSFEVDKGSHGTVDVGYTITGGTVKEMVADSEDFALIVKIDAIGKGTITIDLPRDFIGAEKSGGKDDNFIVLIDTVGHVAYQESAMHADSRVIAIDFEQGDSEIKIIGTYLVPEFGTVVMLILVVGVVTMVLVTRNRFVIRV